MLMTRLPKTLELALASLLFAVPLGTLLGVLAAVYQDKWVDRVLVAFSSLGVAMPSFWSGLMLILLFSVTLRWLPASGTRESATPDPAGVCPGIRRPGEHDPNRAFEHGGCVATGLHAHRSVEGPGREAGGRAPRTGERSDTRGDHGGGCSSAGWCPDR